MDERVKKLLVGLATLVNWDEDDEAWDDPEDLINAAPPLIFEARKILDEAGVAWER